VASNTAGSSLYRGLATALLAAGRATQDAVLEVDEAVLARAIRELQPCLVVLLNLTRDQLDRYHEVGGLARRWRQAVAALPEGATVVANGGKPPTAWVAQAAPSAVVVRVDGGGLGRDHAGCPACGSLLTQAGPGSYGCRHCGWAPGPASVRVERDGRRHIAPKRRAHLAQRRPGAALRPDIRQPAPPRPAAGTATPGQGPPPARHR
jgi:hypothetical protein